MVATFSWKGVVEGDDPHTRSVMPPRLVLPLSGLLLISVSLAQAFKTHPDIHGDRLVFTAESDLWMADVKTGEAWRVTSDKGIESNARFSHDGSQIAFTGNYEGGMDVYVMPTQGGIPRRLTYDQSGDDWFGSVVAGWSQDDKDILFTTSGKISAGYLEQHIARQLFKVSAKGGLPVLLPVPRVNFAALNADGHTLAYVPTQSDWMNWFRYEAGRAEKIWLTDLRTGKFTRLTDFPGRDTQPMWIGSQIVFLSERSGNNNLWQLDPATKAVKQLTFYKDIPVKDPSTDGKRIVFQLGTDLAIYDPATGKAATVPLQLHSDRIHARPFQFAVAEADAAALEPAAKRVALVARGHLVTVAAEESSMRALVDDSAQRVQNPSWSPNGKQIAYLSDASGEEEVYLVGDTDQATPRQLTHGLHGQNGSIVWSPDSTRLLIGNRTGDIWLVDANNGEMRRVVHDAGQLGSSSIETDFRFSPDSKWVAYSSSVNTITSTVSLYEIATGKSTPLSDLTIDSWSPTFSSDGRYLYMLQQRSLTPQWGGNNHKMVVTYEAQVAGLALVADIGTPFDADTSTNKDFRIDLEGIEDRYFDLGVPAESYLQVLAIPGRLLLQGREVVDAYDISSKSLTHLAPKSNMLDLSADSKKLLLKGPNGYQIVDPTGAAVSDTAGALKLSDLTVRIDLEAEWRQIFYESWRACRDFFYDPNMHGADWNAIKAKYEKELPYVGARWDLSMICRDMLGELNVGHTAAGAYFDFFQRPSRIGVLGADLVWDEAAGAYRIQHVLTGNPWNPDQRSPLAGIGMNVRDGDYLLSIQGQKLRKDQDPAALLVGTAGHTIAVTVSDSATGRPRTLKVKPVGNDQDLRLQDWVNSRRAYVEKMSGGQIAYVYLSDMGGTGAKQFAQQYYPNVDRPAIIVDVRGNGGGNISGNVLNDLGGRISGYFSYRAGGIYRREAWAPLGHVAAVTNEYAFSDAEYFSEFFKRMKIGPLVGHRTGGGLVGSTGYNLVDGGVIYVPNYGAWVPGEWVVEGRGAVPDYEVDQDPTSVMAGKDPQLDKAIQLLLDELKKHPFELPDHPAYPIKKGGSRGEPPPKG